MTRRQTSKSRAPSALDELLVAEREIAAGSAQVAAECAALMVAARADATTIEHEAADVLDRALAAQRADAARERARTVAAIAEEATAAIGRYGRMSEGEITTLAEFVAEQVTGLAT